jgi:bifunctional non-homologous end joining protein LigD
MLYVDGGRVRAFTRNDKSLLSTFPELRDIGLHLGSRSAILDGEIVALDEDGRPNFSTLSKRLHVTSKTAIEKLRFSIPASFFAFDLLYLEGRSLTQLPTTSAARRSSRSSSLARRSRRRRRSPIPWFEGDGHLSERGFEGVVIKRRSSRYSPGSRNGDWIKVKNFRTQEVVIGGWTDGKGERDGSPRRAPAGRTIRRGTHVRRQSRHRLHRRDAQGTARSLMPLARKSTPFSAPLSRAETALAHFVRPTVVGEVQFAEWTNDGNLRQPSWRGLRTDKSANEVVRES